MPLIATLAMLVILGLINFLGVRYARQIDLTENRIFTLAPQSVGGMAGLTEPCQAWIFSPAPDPVDRALLENYRRQNPQFTYEYVDPQTDPGVARRFGVQAPGELYLEMGDRRRLVQVIGEEQPLSERRLTNAIAQISNPIEAKVYFLQGHG
ncbi:ABC transporter, partial [bacterium]|nr:ABC transporter [bacterium]